MEVLEKINQIDIRINSLRLELIRAIAEINHMVSTNNAKSRKAEYQVLKQRYYETNQKIEALNIEKKSLMNFRSSRNEAA